MQKRKLYEKPSMKVFELQHRTMLLAGSLSDPDDYNNGGDPFSF